MDTPLAPEVLRRKKFVILCCGVVMYFLTSMSKVLIPAQIIGDLKALGLSEHDIAATGAAYFYAYAASQLLAGIFADRFGGVRILLIGGTMFAAGVLGFPLHDHLGVMLFCRVLTGFGAGTVFLGVAKLVNDLYPVKFSLVLSAILVLGYFGPTVGTTPMTLLIKAAGWKLAMLLPGALVAAALALVVSRMSGTVKPVVTGQTLQPLFAVMRNKAMWFLCLGTSVIFGAYYAVSSYFGKASLESVCQLAPAQAATVIMVLTMAVAVNNMGVNGVLKLCGSRRKLTALTGGMLMVAGAVLGWAAFRMAALPWYMVGAAYLLLALPAGFFPLFCTIGKELCPPEFVALAVALVNFWCFVAIAVFQSVIGGILAAGAGYSGVLLFILIMAAIGVLLQCFYPETRQKQG